VEYVFGAVALIPAGLGIYELISFGNFDMYELIAAIDG
jgi:hypothetical protein